ncbi:biotin/lipoyl-binding protein [Agrobacterium sp. S2]|nr:biotin/lipoyl-binding protein [Agrobacterium sp. S2]
MGGKLSRYPSISWRNIGFAFAGCIGLANSGIPAKSADYMPVTVVAARKGHVTEQITVVGTLAAREQVQIHPAVEGREITKIMIEVGTRVKAGEPLALLDSKETRLALDKNTVSMQRAKVAIAAERNKVDIALVGKRDALKKLERSRSLRPKGGRVGSNARRASKTPMIAQ